jgi:PadR family transcriptional regulator PadR
VTARIRVTYRTRAVLEVLLGAGDTGSWGWAITQATGLRVGTVYPILDRLLQSGWAVTAAETGPHPGRPARTYYRLTGHGKQWAQAAVGPGGCKAQ